MSTLQLRQHGWISTIVQPLRRSAKRSPKAHGTKVLLSTLSGRASNPNDCDKSKQKSVVSLIKDLLFGEPKKPAPSTEKREANVQREEVQATFVSNVRQCIIPESPTERWRRRKVLTEGARANTHDESKDKSGRHSLGWSQEIVFKDQHRKLLVPPRQDRSRQYRKFEHKAERMRSFVQILTTPTADTPGTTLLLHFDNKRYLIGNLSEGTQRAGVQMGAKLLKVSECFLTGRTEWSNTGGLIGMILSLADSAASSRESALAEASAKAHSKGKRLGLGDDPEKMKELEDEATRSVGNNTLTLFGPPNLNHTLATARRFVFRKGMPVNVHEVPDVKESNDGDDEWAPYWADENIKVWAMSIKPSDSTNASHTTGARPTTPRKRSIDEAFGHQTPTDATASKDLTPTERDQLTVKAVVSEMFDSSWRLDTLYETPLSEVRMPASIFIRNADTNKVEKYHGPLPGGETPLPNPHLQVLVRKPWPGALVESLPHTKPADEAIGYFFCNHVQRGKFNKKRALELKVKEGRNFSLLAGGNSVENEDGETITPEMVLGEPKQGGGLAVVDLPDASYIGNLISRPEWREAKVMAGVAAVVWICGRGVATDPRLRDFIKEFSDLQHIISSPDCCPNSIALDSAAAATIRLRKVDPARYRVPVHDKQLVDNPLLNGATGDSHAESGKPLPKDVHIAARGQTIQLEPSIEFLTKQAVPPLSISEVEREMSQDVLDEAAKAQEAIQAEESYERLWAASLPDKDAEVITLGTGSALPSNYRNVSATLVRVSSYGNILLDCGENTLGQLRRVFTADEMKEVLQDLRIIFISHMHADHHLGTASVIRAWYDEVHGGQAAPLAGPDDSIQSLFDGQKRLAVISEPAMQHWLLEYSAVEDFGFSRIAPIHVSNTVAQKKWKSKLEWFVPPSELATLSPAEKFERRDRNTVSPALLGLQDIETVAVQHCHGARAVTITLPSGFKVSYSGDCRPSKAFSQIGKGSTLCIHEATFDDELQGDAEAKNHSTTSEALSVAQAMGARACVLTHFSQRYQKLPVLEHGNGSENGESKHVTQDLPTATDKPEEDVEDTDNGPLDNDAAATFPDQETSNGACQQYDISKQASNKHGGKGTRSWSSSEPSAVKLKLASDMKVAVAFDYMRVKVGEMGQMEKFTPALLKLFAEEDKVVEQPTQSKKGKQQKK